MVGYHPANSPFCCVPKDKFLTAEECPQRNRVEAKKFTPKVKQLLSTPHLG